jgi:hypothetical protein
VEALVNALICKLIVGAKVKEGQSKAGMIDRSSVILRKNVKFQNLFLPFELFLNDIDSVQNDDLNGCWYQSPDMWW